MKHVQLPADEPLHPQHTHEWWYFFADLRNRRTKERLHYTTALMRRDVVWVSYRRWATETRRDTQREPHVVPTPAPGQSELVISPSATDGWSVTIGPRGRSRHHLGKIGTLRFSDPRQLGACLHTQASEGGIRTYGGENRMAWYSRPWLEVRGTLDSSGDEVEGVGWMEHQWGNTDFQRLSWRYLPIIVSDSDVRLIAFRYEHPDFPGSAQMEVAELKNGEAHVIADASIAPSSPGGGQVTQVSLGARGSLTCTSVSDGTIDLRPYARRRFFEGATTGSGTLDGSPVECVAITELHPYGSKEDDR